MVRPLLCLRATVNWKGCIRNIMATVKHISSRNKNYGDALDYLLYDHDEKTGKVLQGPGGEKRMREDFRIGSILCDPSTFALECMELNRKYGKNLGKNEVRSHHYIISFDPKDVTECGLSMDQAQRIGMKIAEKFFSGHQSLVCTHADGHNHSRNMHVYIVINSLRKEIADPQEWMERDSDRLFGNKHRATDRFMKCLKKGVMEICEREGLHQVDLIRPAKEKITDAEYRASQRGQQKLNNVQGSELERKEFQTDLSKIRRGIRFAAETAHSEFEFRYLLKNRYGISMTEDEKKGWRYQLKGSERIVTGRRLGSDFTREYLSIRLQGAGRLVSIENNKKAASSHAYRSAMNYANAKTIANTMLLLDQRGIRSPKELEEKAVESKKALEKARNDLRETERELKRTSDTIHFLGQLCQYRDTYRTYQKAENPEAFREEHYQAIALYETAQKALKEEKERTKTKIPPIAELKKRRIVLEEMKKNQYKIYCVAKAEYDNLADAEYNLKRILETDRRKELRSDKQR